MNDKPVELKRSTLVTIKGKNYVITDVLDPDGDDFTGIEVTMFIRSVKEP